MAITANEARWEDLGPASTNQWLQADFNAMFIAALRANPTFAQFFRVDNDPDIPGNLIIEAGGSSGVSGYPTFQGLLIEFAFPDIIANLTDETNGGNIGVIPTPSGGTAVSAGGAVMFEAVTRERAYVPFDSASPSTTGRYTTEVGTAVLDRLSIVFNDTFAAGTVDETIAGILREGFRTDPTAFWDVPNTMETGTVINLQAQFNGNFDLTATFTSPDDVDIDNDNLIVIETNMGSRSTDPTEANSILNEAPTFLLTPPTGDIGERPPLHITPTLQRGISDRGMLLEAIMTQAMGMGNVFSNWQATREMDATAVNLITIDDIDDDAIPFSLRQGDRPSSGIWVLSNVFPGNTDNVAIDGLSAGSVQDVEGRYSLLTTPSYLGILVRNPAVASGLEFLVVEADRGTMDNPQEDTTEAVLNKWIPEIQNAIPRLALQRRGTGFFMQPANYDDLANFVLDVRLNDNPENANWIYEIFTNGTNPDTGVTGISLNPASEAIFINGSETGHIYDPNVIPNPNDGTYVRSGGPLKVQQWIDGGVSTLANLSNMAETTLIFDIFRPWPSAEINQNLEFPIFATVVLSQDEGGIFRNLNKITGADIGWSKPQYLFTPRATTPDLVNFTETINMGTDDFPRSYESYIERVQMAIQPEFDTEQINSIALWADGNTPEFLRGNQLHNQLSVRVAATNYPGQMTALDGTNMAVNGYISNTFNVSTDYKVDIRVHGRFLNYRITDGDMIVEADNNPSHQAEWRLSGMQADVMKGGTR